MNLRYLLIFAYHCNPKWEHNVREMIVISRQFWIIIALFIWTVHSLSAQRTSGTPIGVIGFYNVENLFDTEDDPEIRDEEFLPEGRNNWTEEKYQRKLINMSNVIKEMSGGPDILGLSEIENRKVVEDLTKTPALKNLQYGIVHFDSPDRRGIDVALIYKASKFKPFDVNRIPLVDDSEPNFKTRDMLWVKGLYYGDTLHVCVVHWPSRRGGKQDKRLLAGKVLRSRVDSVLAINPESKIILMGDFNDDPSNKSIKKELGADLSRDADKLYNTSFSTFKKGYGTLMFRGVWNMFDQIIVSPALLKENKSGYFYKDNTFSIVAMEWMQVKDSGGQPKRTFSRGVYYEDGYSDHYPVYIILAK